MIIIKQNINFLGEKRKEWIVRPAGQDSFPVASAEDSCPQYRELLHCSQMEKDAVGGMSMAKPFAVIHSDIIEIHLLNYSY